MIQYWVEDAGGHRYGPVDEATLRLWAGQGRVAPETPLEDAQSGARRRADAVLAPAAFAAPSSRSQAAPETGFPCPNCRRWIERSAALCPNCGFVLRPAGISLPGRLLTGLPAVDTLLGALAAALILAGPPGLDYVLHSGQNSGGILLVFPLSLIPLVLYLALRRRLPAFARGLGGGLLIGCITVPVLLAFGLAAAIHQWASSPIKICSF